MKELTTIDIVELLYARLCKSELVEQVSKVYRFRHFDNPTGEFIVIAPIANVTNNSQIAVVNVNIYVPDKSPTSGGQKQREVNFSRLGILSALAKKTLKWYDTGERYFFRVESEDIINEENIKYSFVNLKVKLINQ